MEQITIQQVLGVDSKIGSKGPYYLVKIIDTMGRNLSGFVNPTNYRPNEWVSGVSFQADVVPNGKYLNFKLPKASKPTPNPGLLGSASPGAGKAIMALLEQVHVAVEELKLKCLEINDRLKRIEGEKHLTTKSGMTPLGDVVRSVFPSAQSDANEEDPFF